jgi:hypothetical protein
MMNDPYFAVYILDLFPKIFNIFLLWAYELRFLEIGMFNKSSYRGHQ